MKTRDNLQQIWFFRSSYNSKAISTYYERSDALSHVELRILPSTQIAILHYIIREKVGVEKNDGSRQNSDVFQS